MNDVILFSPYRRQKSYADMLPRLQGDLSEVIQVYTTC